MTDITLPIMPYSWQQEHWQQLQQLIESERMPHALLLNGAADIGKTQFANALAQQLLCEVPALDNACGQCKQCLMVSAGTHPDLLRLEPEGAGKAIKIDDVRSLGNLVAKTSQQGGWKVAIIQPAEAMNINAANALLKNLEEPSDKTLLILVSHQTERIPATVRSRCRILKFPLPATSITEPWLQQVTGNQNTQNLLELANNRPLLALRLLESDLLGKRQQFDELIERVARGDESPLKAAEWCKGEVSLEVIDWFQNNVNQRIRARTNEQASGSKNNSLLRLLFRFTDRMLAAKQRLQSSANPNPQLLWEELLLDWQALFTIKRE